MALRNNQSYLMGQYRVWAKRGEDGLFILTSLPRHSYVWRVESDGTLSAKDGDRWIPEPRFRLRDLDEIVGSVEVEY